MRALWLGLALFLITGVSPTSAHDIGVVQAELLEGDGNRYVISVSVRPAAAYVFQAPILPKRCLIMGNPRGAQGSDQLRFEFVCDKALTAVDELRLPWRREGAMLTAKWRDGSEVKRFFRRKAGHIPVRLSDLLAGSGSWKDGAGRYFDLGVQHILLGIDHLLFVLALLLIVRGGWMLVKTITAFTVAHSITLALATLGFINVPPRPLEAMIALSIVFLCVEIVHARQGRTGLTYQHPWLVAFAFGLLHGLGFAGALSEIGLALSEIPLALLFFNIGVEIGQLMFVVGLLGFLWGLQRLQFQAPGWARAIPVYAIGTLATYWLLERLEAIVTAV